MVSQQSPKLLFQVRLLADLHFIVNYFVYISRGLILSKSSVLETPPQKAFFSFLFGCC